MTVGGSVTGGRRLTPSGLTRASSDAGDGCVGVVSNLNQGPLLSGADMLVSGADK